MYLSQLFASLFSTTEQHFFLWWSQFSQFFLLQKLQGKVPFLTKGPFAIFFGGTDILTGLGDQVPLILMTDDTDNDTDDTDLWYTVVWPLKDVRPGALCLVFKKDKLFSIVSFEKKFFSPLSGPKKCFDLVHIPPLHHPAHQPHRVQALQNEVFTQSDVFVKICAFVKAAKLSNYQILVT